MTNRHNFGAFNVKVMDSEALYIALEREAKHSDLQSVEMTEEGLIAVFSLFVHGFTDFNFQIPSNILLFSVVLSLTYVTVTYQPSEE